MTGEALLSRRSKVEIPNFHLIALKMAILSAVIRGNATVVSITFFRNLSQKLINFDAVIRWNFEAIIGIGTHLFQRKFRAAMATKPLRTMTLEQRAGANSDGSEMVS